MEWFSKSVKRAYDKEDCERIETALQWLISRKVRSIDGRALSPVSKVPAKIHDLLQIGLRRTIELAEGAIRELNQRNITNSYVLVRGTRETTCLLLDSGRRVEDVVKKDDPAGMNELDKFLMDVLMGFKSKEQGFSEEYTARNVLTIIQRLDAGAGAFAALCESDIYQGGTWPKGVEYPVKRG